jgi:hypothetical protein
MQWPPSDRGVEVHGLPVNVPAGGAAVWTTRGRLLGWVLNVPAQPGVTLVTLLDGADPGGDPIGSVSVPAGGDSVRLPALPGIPLEAGLMIVCPVTVTGSVFIGEDL